MKKILFNLIVILMITLMSCQDQLDIQNPNAPTIESAKTEPGIIALAQGALYTNGFQVSKFGGAYFATVLRYHDLMGDAIQTPIADFARHQVSCPQEITLDNGSKLKSPFLPPRQIDFLRSVNIPSVQANPYAHEWTLMYALNGVLNSVLINVDDINMPQVKKFTVKAWVYFWKGFAYSRIGSLYYAGIINNKFNETNNHYVSRQEILAEAENNFSQAEVQLDSILSKPVHNADYTATLTALIPNVCRVGKGLPLSVMEWKRNINTMRARNILVNAPADQITTSQWNEILALTTDGTTPNDKTFTIRTDVLGQLLGNGHNAAAAIGAATDGGGGNKISERLIQDFKSGDKRLANNFNAIPAWIGQGAYGTGFNTRYVLVNKGKGMAGVIVMVNRDVGAHEIYLAGSYEENLLMKAEANIYLGNVDSGLALIDELRTYQGAGLAAVAGTGLTGVQAKEELRRERRVGLVFRGLSFYDARRWGVIENGRTGVVVIDFTGTVNTNATIDYHYLDYWDVPIAELFYNPPSADSAPVVNPKN